MKKRIIALLLCMSLAVLTLASCDMVQGGEPKTHTHTYAATWSTDATSHWYDATCDCEDAEINKLAHADKNKDGICDICEYADPAHTHEYAEDWTIDCTYHWHVAVCEGHEQAPVSGKAEHVDADTKDADGNLLTHEDGVCDVCGYVIEDRHVHIYSETWTTDDQYHWHAPICEHEWAEVEKIAHKKDDSGLFCSECGKQIGSIAPPSTDDGENPGGTENPGDGETPGDGENPGGTLPNASFIKEMLEVAVARNDKVTGGSVIYTNVINITDTWIESNTEEIFFSLGNGNAYINRISYGVAEQQWYQLLEAGEKPEDYKIFGVTSIDGGLTLESVQGTPALLNGYTYNPSTILGDASGATLSELLLAFYILSEDAYSTNGEDGLIAKDVSYDAETNVYTMNFTYVKKNVLIYYQTDADGNVLKDENGADIVESTEVLTDLYTVTSTFTFDANYVVNYAELTLAAYAPGDGDYTYDAATDKISMNADAKADTYSYVVSQFSGERTYTSPYSKEMFLPASFDLTYNGQPVGDKLTVDAGTLVNLQLANIAPLTAKQHLMDLSDVKIELVNINDPTQTISGWFDSFNSAVCFYAGTAGVYNMTVTYFDFTFTTQVLVKPAEATEVGIYQLVEEQGYDAMVPTVGDHTAINEITLTVGESVMFTGRVEPSTAAQGYRYDIDHGTLTLTTIESAVVFNESMADDPETADVNEAFQAITFTADEAGVYTVTFVADIDSNVTGTLVITVVTPEPEPEA